MPIEPPICSSNDVCAASGYEKILGFRSDYLVKFCKWARLPGFQKGGPDYLGLQKFGPDYLVKKLYFFCKKWTRLPGGPDYLVAAHSGPDYLGAAKSGPDYLDRCFRVFFAVSLPSLVGGKPAGPDYLVAAQSGPDYLGAAKWGADYLEFTLFLAALRPARTSFAHRAAGDAALAGSAAPTGEPLELARARASGPSGGTVLCRAARVDGARRWWASCVRGAALGFCVVVC